MFQYPSLHIESHWHLNLHHMTLAASNSVHGRKQKEKVREKVGEPALTSNFEGKDAHQLLAFCVETTRLSAAPRPYADCLLWPTLTSDPQGEHTQHLLSSQSVIPVRTYHLLSESQAGKSPLPTTGTFQRRHKQASHQIPDTSAHSFTHSSRP